MNTKKTDLMNMRLKLNLRIGRFLSIKLQQQHMIRSQKMYQDGGLVVIHTTLKTQN